MDWCIYTYEHECVHREVPLDNGLHEDSPTVVSDDVEDVKDVLSVKVVVAEQKVVAEDNLWRMSWRLLND